MKTVLLAWERGSNLGHAARLARIARRLSGEGLRIAVAGRDLVNTRIAFSGVDYVLLQAPVWPAHEHPGSPSGQAGYLDVLVSLGFADPEKLGAVLAGWDAILDLVRPDAVVIDHSPGLVVARHGRAIPALAVGSGYTMPPLDYPNLPPVRADRSPMMPEGRLAEAIRGVLVQRGRAMPRDLPALFRTDVRIVHSFPELDPYRAFRQEPLHLPADSLPAFVDPPVEPRLFVYLGDEVRDLAGIVQALAETEIPLVAYLRGSVGPLPDFLEMRGHEVHRRPPSLADVLPGVSHVFSAGGSFLCHAALAAGRPHLITPQHNEAELNLDMLAALGAGTAFRSVDDDGVRNRAAIDAFVRNHSLTEAARAFAATVALRPQPAGDAAAAEALRGLLAQGG